MDCLTCCTSDYSVRTPVGLIDADCFTCGDKQNRLAGRLIEAETGEVYNTDVPLVIAIKFIGLFISNPFRLAIQIVYRLYDLLSGAFIHRAAMNHRSATKEFFISVGKFLLLPVGLIARSIICLIGIFFAYHARKWYAKVEQFFYMAPEDMFEPQPALDMFGNLTAPCMQPVSFYRDNNLFRYWGSFRYNRDTTRSLFAQLEQVNPNVGDLKKALFPILSDWDDRWEARAIKEKTRYPAIEELATLLKEAKTTANLAPIWKWIDDHKETGVRPKNESNHPNGGSGDTVSEQSTKTVPPAGGEKDL